MSRDTCPECADDLRDELVALADAGEACPRCSVRGYVAKRLHAKYPFRCQMCGCEWRAWDELRNRQQ